MARLEVNLMIPPNSGRKCTEMNQRNAQTVYWFVLGFSLLANDELSIDTLIKNTGT